jgi:transposase
VTIAVIEGRIPTLVEARTLIERFQAMLRQKVVADLDAWIASAGASLIASYVSGIIKDKDAVRAAITEPWSNGQSEGQITKLKLVKRHA